MTDSYIMSIALKEAKKCLKENLLPVGAVLVCDGQIVGKARKLQENSFHLDHAEIVLIRNFFKSKKIDRNDHSISLYTTLEPCIMCLGTIMHLPICKIVYAARDPYGGATSILNNPNLPPRHQKNTIEIISCICENESKKIIAEYINSTDSFFYKNKQNPLVNYILTN